MLQVDIGIHDALLLISGGHHLTPGTEIEKKEKILVVDISRSGKIKAGNL